MKAKSMMETLVLNPTTDSQTRVQVMRKIIHDAEAQRRDSTYVLDLFNQLLDKQQEDAGMALLCTQYKLQKQMPETEITASLRKVLELDPTNLLIFLLRNWLSTTTWEHRSCSWKETTRLLLCSRKELD